MKKLMIATLAAAAVGGAFAAPLVWDYKASVKHTYEKDAVYRNADVYVKYVKSAKLQGYFVQDYDALSPFAQASLSGANFSQKKGFLVLVNKSAEVDKAYGLDYRVPKIMPAQLDVKALATSSNVKGSSTTTKQMVEAYFYAGPFASHPDGLTTWDASYDDGKDFLINVGAAPFAAGIRSYGTFGSTYQLFGQHNVYNRCNNDLATSYEPAGMRAFGDAWMNGAGFGTGGGKGKLCCNWPLGSASLGSISGNLKGGLFLCSIPNRPIYDPAQGGYFTLGIENVYMDDTTKVLARILQGDDPTVADKDGSDQKSWADGELALATTDVVTGTWTLKPASAKFKPATLDADEVTWLTANAPGFIAVPNDALLLRNIKAALQKLDPNFMLYTDTEPYDCMGFPSDGLLTPNFAGTFL